MVRKSGILCVAALLCAFMSSVAFAAPRVYQLSDNQPDGYPTVMGAKNFAQLVEERTNGGIRIDVYPGAVLYDEREAIEALQAGKLAFCRVNLLSLSDFCMPLGVLALPYIFRDEDHLWKVLDGPLGDELLAELEYDGITGLAYYDSGARSFYNSKREVKTPEDLKGLKIRVQQSRQMIGLLEALGALAEPMRYGDVYAALQRGLIDGAENNWGSYYSASHYKIAGFYTLDRHTRAPEVLCASWAVWEELSPEDREIIRQAARESERVQKMAWKQYEERAIRIIRESGKCVITEVSDPAAWRKAVVGLYDTIDLGPKKEEYIRRVDEVR